MCIVKVLWSTLLQGIFFFGRFLSGRAFRCKSSLGCGLYPAIPNAICANARSPLHCRRLLFSLFNNRRYNCYTSVIFRFGRNFSRPTVYCSFFKVGRLFPSLSSYCQPLPLRAAFMAATAVCQVTLWPSTFVAPSVLPLPIPLSRLLLQ